MTVLPLGIVPNGATIQLPAALVVTVHVEDVVTPSETLPVTKPVKLALDVIRIAIVSPGIKPETLVPPQTPFLAIAEQDPTQFAVSGPVKPEMVTAFEEVRVEGSTSA